MRLTLSTLLLFVCVVGVALGWAVDRARMQNMIQSEKRAARLKTGVDINGALLRHSAEMSEDEFYEFVRTKLVTVLCNLWHREHEYNNSKDVFGGYAEDSKHLARKLLYAQKIKNHGELITFALNQTRYNRRLYRDPRPDYLNNSADFPQPINLDPYTDPELRFPEIHDSSSEEFHQFKQYIDQVFKDYPNW